MSAAAITSSPKISPHSSKLLLLVSTVEARSYRRLISWKKSMIAYAVQNALLRNNIVRTTTRSSSTAATTPIRALHV